MSSHTLTHIYLREIPQRSLIRRARMASIIMVFVRSAIRGQVRASARRGQPLCFYPSKTEIELIVPHWSV